MRYRKNIASIIAATISACLSGFVYSEDVVSYINSNGSLVTTSDINDNICVNYEHLTPAEGYRGPLENIVALRKDAVVVFSDGVPRPNNPKDLICSGTLIDENIVLTAEHCKGDIDRVHFFWGEAGKQATYLFDHYIETGNDQVDYVLIQLAGNPASDLGITPTPLKAFIPTQSQTNMHDVVLIQHPTHRNRDGSIGLDGTKVVATGKYSHLEVPSRATQQSAGTVWSIRVPRITGGRSSSGSGLLDKNGNLLGITIRSPALLGKNCDEGDEFAPVAEMAKVSSYLREKMLPITIQTHANIAYSKISASCTSPQGVTDTYGTCTMQYMRGSGIEVWREMENKGCTISCKPGDSVLLSCEEYSRNRWVDTETTKDITIAEIGKKYGYQRADHPWESQFYGLEKPITARCSITD